MTLHIKNKKPYSQKSSFSHLKQLFEHNEPADVTGFFFAIT